MPLRPAHEVYHRLRWDPAIDETTAEVVVLDRSRGPVMLPFADFDPNGEIPWSRVIGFRLHGEVVWDRETRVDRVFGTGATPGEGLHTSQSPSPGPPGGRGTLRVLSLNVLFDRYDREAVRTAERTPMLVTLLDRLDADLVALQEVEPWLCVRLVDEGLIPRYHASDPGDGSTLRPYGQLLLSRYPLLAVHILPLGGDKRHVIASVALPSGRTTVAVVHLSSDRHDDAPERRARQLAALRPRLGPGPTLVLGDVNQDEPVDLPLEDAWLLCHPEDPGYTWDPARNALARMISRTGTRRRLDRVLVRGFDVEDIALVGVDPSGLPLSDHHGLLATLRPEEPVVRTETWAIPLPPDAARVLAPLQRRFDPDFAHQPGMLTLGEAPTPSAEPLDAAAAYSDRTITLDRVVSLDGAPRRVAVRAAPGSEATVADLREALGMPREGPAQVVVAVAPDPTTEAAITEALRRRLPLTVSPCALERWVHRRGAPPTSGDLAARAPRRARVTLEEVLEQLGLAEESREDPAALVASIAEAAGGTARLVGPARVGGQLPESDLTVVVRHPDPPAAHHAIRAAFTGSTTTGPSGVTRFPASLGDPPLPRTVEVSVLEPSADGPESAWSELAERLEDPVPRRVLRALQGWAAARQVHDPSWGFLPGLAMARSVADAEPARDLSAAFLRTLAQVRTLAARLADGAAESSGARFVVVPAVARVLVEEVERALALGWDDEWERLFAAASPEPGPGMHLELTAPPEAEGALLAWLRGQAPQVLATIARTSSDVLRLRPYPHPVRRASGARRLTVAWANADPGAVEQAITELEARFDRAVDRPAGTSLSVVSR